MLHQLLPSMRPALALFAALTMTLPGFGQEPSVEYSSLLDGVSVYPDTGKLTVANIFGVFMPKESLYNDRDLVREHDQTYAVLRNAEGTELGRFPLFNRPYESVFTTLNPVPGRMEFQFEQAGRYELTIQIDDKVLSRLPMLIERVESGDPFAPIVRTYVDGPWGELACLRMSDVGAPDGYPVFRAWTRAGRFNPSGKDEDLELEVRNDGHVVFISTKKILPARIESSDWMQHDFSLTFPESEGRQMIRTRDLLKKDGTYEFLLRRAGKAHSVFRMEVAGGKTVAHARQQMNYQPHVDYLCGRIPASARNGGTELVWMDRRDASAPDGLLTTAAPAAAVEASVRSSWVAAPKFDPSRPFDLHLTKVAARMDAGIAVGEELVVFGTGPNKGVAYMVAGEDEEHTLPNGQNYHSKMFGVCGRKIALVRDSQLVIFDTESGITTEIPADQVWLARTFANAFGPTPLATDGHLIAVINDATKVADRRIVKIIDVSGTQPRIYSMRNPEVPHKELNTIAVHAASGMVALGSQRTAKLLHGGIAPDGNLTEVDLSGYDSFGQQSPIALTAGYAAYVDDSSSKRLHTVDLSNGKVQTVASVGQTGMSFAMAPKHMAFLTTENSGSNYRVATGPFEQGNVEAKEAANLGVSSPGNGNFGMGVTMGLASDGSCFLAGSGKGGIGSGELLQVLQNGQWNVVVDADGTPVSAVDVVAGPGLVAFKTGKASDTRIGYARFGEKPAQAQIPVAR
ncbi:MAG: hypothetical protein R3F17_08075 [Planctomycetota bacterium]